MGDRSRDAKNQDEKHIKEHSKSPLEIQQFLSHSDLSPLPCASDPDA